MKGLKIFFSIGFLLFGKLAFSQDTLFIHKKIGGIKAIPISNVDSIIFYDSKTVADADGNVYTTVTIGTQVWMAQNLKTTKYNDGTAINLVTDNTAWSNLSTGAWCYYNNDSQYENTYGKLYNWYAVNTSKLCPTGWHVPTDADWTTLTNYLAANGHSGSQGTALKSTTGWNSGNGTDNYGWNGLPGGIRNFNSTFGYIGNRGYWWSSSEHDALYAFYRKLDKDDSIVYGYYYNKKSAFSVRCVKN